MSKARAPFRIPLSAPRVTEHEVLALERALLSGWLAPAGPSIEEFEQLIAQVCDSEFAVAVNSGTSALHLALIALDVKQGDRVLVPTLTFAASAFAVTYTGAQPVFIDVDPRTWCIDVELLEATLATARRDRKQFAAVMTVDLFGRMPDYLSITSILSDFGIPLVEDAAEALGSRFLSHAAGSLGNVRAMSFNGNKIVTAAGGGAVLTDSEVIAIRLRSLANQAKQDVHWFEHDAIGYNYRLSNLQAAVGIAQLQRLSELLNSRHHWHRMYESRLNGKNGVLIVADPSGCESNHWLTNAVLPAHIDAKRVVARMHSYGVEVRMNWKPMHQQPIFQGYEAHLTGVADNLFGAGLCLPSGPGLSEANIEEVCQLLIDTVEYVQ